MRRILIIAAVLLWPAAGHAYEICDHGVKFSDGSTYRDFTGTITCKDSVTGQPKRIVTLKDGKENGLSVFYEDGKKLYERELKDGRRNGREIYYYPGTDQVKTDALYENDRQKGLYKKYYKNGQLSDLRYEGGARESGIKYTEQGKVYDVECGEVMVSPEHETLCYEKTTLYGTQGNVSETVERAEGGVKDGESVRYHENGAVAEKTMFRQGKKDGDSWLYAGDGKPLNHRVYQDGILRRDEIYDDKTGQIAAQADMDETGAFARTLIRYYENGKMQEEMTYRRAGEYEGTLYDGRGVKYSRGLYRIESCTADLCLGPQIGEHERYREDGSVDKRQTYSLYQPGGSYSYLSREVTYDAQGAVLSDQSFFSDGSVKD